MEKAEIGKTQREELHGSRTEEAVDVGLTNSQEGTRDHRDVLNVLFDVGAQHDPKVPS